MKNVFGYGIAVLALSAAPVLAQAGGGTSGSGSTSGRTGGSTAGTQSGSGTTTGSQSGSRAGSQSGSQAGTRSGGQQAGKAGGADQHFVMDAAQGGLAEVELGQLAAQKAQSDQVKQFAQRMVQDHGKANDELKSLAQQKNITVPTDLAAKDKATRDRLSKLSGAQFDRAYMQTMLMDHRKDLTEFRTESRSGKDPDVKAWASKTLPTLQEHLTMAQSASRGAVGTSGNRSSGAGTQGSTGRTNSGSGTTGGSTSGRQGTSGAGSSSGSGSTNNPR